MIRFPHALIAALLVPSLLSAQDTSDGPQATLSAGLGYSAERGAIANLGLSAPELFDGSTALNVYGAWEEEGHSLTAVLRSGNDINIPVLGRSARYRFSVSNRVSDWDDDEFSSRRTGFSAGLDFRIGVSGSTYIDYFIYEDRIHDVSPATSSLIAADAGTRTASGLAWGARYDTTDHPFAPRSGIELDAEVSAAGLGGDARWASAALSGAYYLPLGDTARIRFGGMAGVSQGYDGDTLRITERAFLSAELPRGFASRGIGPRDLTTDTALGGERYAALSLDVARQIAELGNTAFQGHIFAEAGSVWSLANTTLIPAGTVDDDFHWRSSVGVAVSAETAIGVFEIYYAQPVNQESYDDTQSFGLSLAFDF